MISMINYTTENFSLTNLVNIITICVIVKKIKIKDAIVAQLVEQQIRNL